MKFRVRASKESLFEGRIPVNTTLRMQWLKQGERNLSQQDYDRAREMHQTGMPSPPDFPWKQLVDFAPKALQYCDQQTDDICLAAVTRSGFALQFVKEQTEEICLEAVKRDGTALQFVKEQTEEICAAALKDDYNAGQYIKKWTMALYNDENWYRAQAHKSKIERPEVPGYKKFNPRVTETKDEMINSLVEKVLNIIEASSIEYRGETFSGYNKPKRTPDHPEKSHAVLAKDGDDIKMIRFGQQGVSGSPEKEGESEADRKRRKSFKARHAKNIKRGKMSAAYWANKVKW